MPRIDAAKYQMVRRAILRAVPHSSGGVPFKVLPAQVKNRLTPSQRRLLGSVSWYTTVVKLDLEARGEIERVPGARPQRLRRS